MGCKTWRNYDIIRHSRLIVLSHESNGHYNQSLFLQAAWVTKADSDSLVGGSREKLKPFSLPVANSQQLRKVTSGLESHICKYQIPMARQVSRTSPWVGQSSRNITQTGAAFELQNHQLLDDFLLAQPSWLLSAYQRKNLEILMAHALQVIIKLCSALLLSTGTA